MDDLLRAFMEERLHGFTEESFAEMADHFCVKKATRGEKLLKPGNIVRWLYFVNRGCLRTYLLTHRDDDITTDFAFEGVFNSVMPAFLLKQPADYFIEAFENSELLAISNTSFMYLSLKYMNFFHCLLYMTYERGNEVHWAIQSSKAVERYKWLKKCRPQLIARIPDKYIASYLGMSSRTYIRAKNAAGK